MSILEEEDYICKIPFVDTVTQKEEIMRQIEAGNKNFEIDYLQVIQHRVRNLSISILKMLEEESKKINLGSNEDWSSSLLLFSVIKRAENEFYSVFPKKKVGTAEKESFDSSEATLDQKIEISVLAVQEMFKALEAYEKQPETARLQQIATLMSVVQPRIKAIYSNPNYQMGGHTDVLLQLCSDMKAVAERTRHFVSLAQEQNTTATIDSPQISMSQLFPPLFSSPYFPIFFSCEQKSDQFGSPAKAPLWFPQEARRERLHEVFQEEIFPPKRK